MGNEDLGTHYYNIGELGKAVKAYSNMRDFCTTPGHIASSAFRIVAVVIEQYNWLAVQSSVHKIRNLQMRADDQARTVPKCSAAMGLCLMSQSDYKEAAFSFLATDASLGDSYNEIITSNDVAVYGGLCALASMSRDELQSKVLDNPSFRNFLELEPHIRRAISFFVSCKYAQCLEILEMYRADYLLDIYMQPHVKDIYQKIRTKSIIQYFEPFSRVKLETMENMFGAPNSSPKNNGISTSFIDEVIGLIESNKLNALIDLESMVLIAKETDERAQMQEEVLNKTKGYLKESKLKLMRQQAIAAGLIVQAPSKKGKGAAAEWNGGGGDDGFMDEGMGMPMQRGAGGGGGHFNGKGYSLR